MAKNTFSMRLVRPEDGDEIHFFLTPSDRPDAINFQAMVVRPGSDAPYSFPSNMIEVIISPEPSVALLMFFGVLTLAVIARFKRLRGWG